MEYGKIIDNEFVALKLPVKTADKQIFTNDTAILLEHGFKPVKFTNPEAREGFSGTGYIWEESGDEIVQVWQYSEVSEFGV